MRRNISVILLIIMIFLPSCTASAVGGDDSVSAELRDSDIIMLSEKLGIDMDLASEIYDALLMTEFSGGIKYVTAWNDGDFGGVYYRVRNDTDKREIYLYSDQSFRIKDGETDFSEGSETETVPETEKITEPMTETEKVTEKAVETAEETTDPITEADADTTSAPTELLEFILNKNTKKYHKPSCSSANRIKESNREVVFVKSADELHANGYEPCGICGK